MRHELRSVSSCLCDHCSMLRRRGSIKLMESFGHPDRGGPHLVPDPVRADLPAVRVVPKRTAQLRRGGLPDNRGHRAAALRVADHPRVRTRAGRAAAGHRGDADRPVPVRWADADEPRRAHPRARTSRSRPPARRPRSLFVLVCLGVDLAIVGPHRLLHAVALDGTVPITPVLLSLSWLRAVNVLLLVFNLIPAFPLDGGRIARAACGGPPADSLAARGSPLSSGRDSRSCWPESASGCCSPTGASPDCGCWRSPSCWVSPPGPPGSRPRLPQRIEGVRVSDMMDPQPVSDSVGHRRSAQALDEFFLRYGGTWLPVVDPRAASRDRPPRARSRPPMDGGEGWLTVGSVLERRGRRG